MLTIEQGRRHVDRVESEYQAGRGWMLQKRRGDRAVITRGTREERRRLIAERYFGWARRYATPPQRELAPATP
jgi:hypothetical protein